MCLDFIAAPIEDKHACIYMHSCPYAFFIPTPALLTAYPHLFCSLHTAMPMSKLCSGGHPAILLLTLLAVGGFPNSIKSAFTLELSLPRYSPCGWVGTIHTEFVGSG